MAVFGQTNVDFSPVTKIFTPGVVILLALSLLGFALSWAAPGFCADVLAISAPGVFGGKIWQLVTYPFVGSCAITLVFTSALILFIGSSVEREWRTASFVVLWAVLSVVCGLLWVIITSAVGGNYAGARASGCAYGLLATFGLLNRGRRLLFFVATIEAQHMVLLLIAAGIILTIMQPIGLIWVLGAPVGYFYVKLRWKVAARRAAAYKKPDARRPGQFVDID